MWKLSQPPDVLDEYYTEILDEHFRCQKLIYQHYKYRKTDSLALDKVVNACQQQILIAPQAVYAFKHKYKKPLPTHLGFEQLVSIYEKQKNYTEAIRVSKEALSQGWRGNWERRIARCQKRLSKQTQRDHFSLAWLQITASKATSRKGYPIQNRKSKI